MTVTDRLLQAVTAELRDRRAELDGDRRLHSITLVVQIRKDGPQTLFRKESGGLLFREPVVDKVEVGA